jgi:gas vesicle protein
MKYDKLLYFLAGTGIGAVIGMLFSPASGLEMRNKLSAHAQEGMDQLSQKVGEGKRYLEESEVGRRAGATIRGVVDRGKNVANIGKHRFHESIEAGRNRFNEKFERTQTELHPDRDEDSSAM